MDQSTLPQRPGASTGNGSFTQDILNAIAANVAVLDRNGTVVAVNDAWRRLSGEDRRAAGEAVPGMALGANFLNDSKTGVAVGAGIRTVLEGHAADFSVEYACHSPQQRCFLLTAMPIGHSARDGVVVTQTDITERKQTEERLRVVTIASECLDGVAVMDATKRVLWVNQAFTKITGLPAQQVVGTRALLKQLFRSASFHEQLWNDVDRTGAWQGQAVLQRHGSGETYHVRGTMARVVDELGRASHYVTYFTDATLSQEQEAQRLLNETAYRKTLVREVHHRIKNNLQGITGILRQFADRYPATTEPINQAIGQVNSISVIHGLLGRAVPSSVRLCELTGAIAEEIGQLWQTRIALDIPPAWLPCIIAEEEAVPIALVLNELILNAVKHGGKADGGVQITLRKGAETGVVRVSIANAGQLLAQAWQSSVLHNGLQLVAALMPRDGASISREQSGKLVVTMVQFESPVIVPQWETAP